EVLGHGVAAGGAGAHGERAGFAVEVNQAPLEGAQLVRVERAVAPAKPVVEGAPILGVVAGGPDGVVPPEAQGAALDGLQLGPGVQAGLEAGEPLFAVDFVADGVRLVHEAVPLALLLAGDVPVGALRRVEDGAGLLDEPG